MHTDDDVTKNECKYSQNEKEYGLSVIVPCLNEADSIVQVLENILHILNGLLNCASEIIVVDDGSEDDSGIICDEYAKKDKRVRIIHKTNGGLSSARNFGIDIATGSWIGFVDSDDWLALDMYGKLYSSVKRENADLAICGFIRCDENGNAIETVPSIVYSVLTRHEAFNKLVGPYNVFYITAWNKLYNKQLFTKLRFPEGRLHEDEFIAHYIFDLCNVIVTIPEYLYMYSQRSNSIMRRPYSLKRLDGCLAILDRHDFFKAKGSIYYRHALRCLRQCYKELSVALTILNFTAHKTILSQYYKKVFWLLIKNGDLKAVKLFVFRHRWLYKLAKYMKDSIRIC